MLQFAGFAQVLGLLVFIVGMVVLYLANNDDEPKYPFWLRGLVVVAWACVSLSLSIAMKYVQNSGQTITISIVLLFCFVALLLGWVVYRGTLWMGRYNHSRRGGLMFREVMARKKEGRAFDGQRRWQQ